MKNTLLSFALIFGAIALFTSCDDEIVIPNEEELITTLIYTLTPEGGGTPIEFKFTDLDGDGGNTPVVTSGILDTNTTYNGQLTLLNESETPVEDITEEIEEEDEEHQFFFFSSLLSTNISYNDMDSDGNPIGLATIVQTGEAGSGTLTITLRHEPDKNASGVSNGTITNAGGETDIEVEFDITIQ